MKAFFYLLLTFTIISISYASHRDLNIHCNGESNGGCCTAISGSVGGVYVWSADRGKMSPAITNQVNYTEFHCPKGLTVTSIDLHNNVEGLVGHGTTSSCVGYN